MGADSIIAITAIVAIGCSGRNSDRERATNRAPAPEVGPTQSSSAVTIDAAPVPADANAPPDAPSAEQIQVDALVHELDSTPYVDGLRRLDTMHRVALASLARFGDCGWAVRAALVLERRGDASFLPRRGAANEPAVLARMLCMIANLPTSTTDGPGVVSRQPEFLEDFLPPRGKVHYATQGCADDGNVGPVSTSSFTRGDASGDELDDRFLSLTGIDPGKRPGDVVVTGVGHATATSVTLSPAKDDRLYISSIEYQSLGACD